MIDWFLDFYEENSYWIVALTEVIRFVGVIVNVGLLVLLSRLIGSLKYKKIELSCGSFSVNRKNYDVQNITNIVSLYFYDGAKIPDNIRKEILEKTVPNVKDLRRSLIK